MKNKISRALVIGLVFLAFRSQGISVLDLSSGRLKLKKNGHGDVESIVTIIMIVTMTFLNTIIKLCCCFPPQFDNREIDTTCSAVQGGRHKP